MDKNVKIGICAIVGFVLTIVLFLTIFSLYGIEKTTSVIISMITGIIVTIIILIMSGILKKFTIKGPGMEWTGVISNSNENIKTMISKKGLNFESDESTDENNVSKADIEKIKSHIEINQDIKNEIKQPEEFDEEFAMSKAGFYFKIKNYSKSVEYLDRILEKDPKNIHALFRKGLVLKNEKKDAEAIIYLDLALEIKKGKEIEIQKMICLNNLKKHNEALEIANGILHENPKDYDILHKKGIILNDMDKFSEARKIFSKCLEKNSKNIRVMTSIATSYMREQKLQEAVSTLEGILEIEPKNIRSLIRLTHLKETL